jgi:hypothetical protein
MNLREEQAAMRERQRRSSKRGNKQAGKSKTPPAKSAAPQEVTDAN